MRMRKKSWAAPYLQAQPNLVLTNPEVHQGTWRTYMNIKELHLEIGCGKGEYCLQMAEKNPSWGFVAVEKDVSAGAVAAKKIVTSNVPNIKLVVQDAVDIRTWFADGEIDVIHLNFSDPWPKLGHHKRRLSHPSFLDKYAALLTADGEIQMKTDNRDLFEFSVVQFSECDWQIVSCSVDFRRKEQEDAISEYESKFIALGQPIYRIVVKKKSHVQT